MVRTGYNKLEYNVCLQLWGCFILFWWDCLDYLVSWLYPYGKSFFHLVCTVTDHVKKFVLSFAFGFWCERLCNFMMLAERWRFMHLCILNIRYFTEWKWSSFHERSDTVPAFCIRRQGTGRKFDEATKLQVLELFQVALNFLFIIHFVYSAVISRFFPLFLHCCWTKYLCNKD